MCRTSRDVGSQRSPGASRDVQRAAAPVGRKGARALQRITVRTRSVGAVAAIGRVVGHAHASAQPATGACTSALTPLPLELVDSVVPLDATTTREPSGSTMTPVAPMSAGAVAQPLSGPPLPREAEQDLGLGVHGAQAPGLPGDLRHRRRGPVAVAAPPNDRDANTQREGRGRILIAEAILSPGKLRAQVAIRGCSACRNRQRHWPLSPRMLCCRRSVPSPAVPRVKAKLGVRNLVRSVATSQLLPHDCRNDAHEDQRILAAP